MEWERVAADLQTWFNKNQRDLPWRRDPAPYNILLSEFILQQTRIEVGLRYYEKLRMRFPTLASLARAREASVLSAWSGLGYYSRARNLHRTAREIQRRFAGEIPADAELLQTLPGIGPYTAGAIASIAYDRPVPSIDGNQERVLSRLTGTPRPTTSDARRNLQQTATQLLKAGSPRTLNQALMDLGSQVCLPETPRCTECPLISACATRGPGPRTPKRNPNRIEHWQADLHVKDDKIWLEPTHAKGLLGSLWLPPMKKTGPRRRFHLEHAFSHKTWRIHIAKPSTGPKGEGRWVSRQALQKLPHSSLTLRLLEHALSKRLN